MFRSSQKPLLYAEPYDNNTNLGDEIENWYAKVCVFDTKRVCVVELAGMPADRKDARYVTYL
jgi:hypothetical protein